MDTVGMSTTRTRLTGSMSHRLRQARESAGLTQQQIAAMIGAALKTVSNYENPDYTGARKSYVVRAWAEVTDRTFEEVWGTPGREISNRACNGGTRSAFLTRDRDPNVPSVNTLPLRRRSA